MIEDKLLGKRVDYPKTYCPEILVAVPRSLNREIYGIYQANELFCGYDSWHAYEASFILNNGMPIAGMLKIVYPSTSKYIVESKSLKLYLGSYNMMPLGDNQQEGIDRFTHQIANDLSRTLSTQVEVHFFSKAPAKVLPFDFKDYSILEELIVPQDIQFSTYQEYPVYLQENINTQSGELKIASHLLKSNCKITNQPDWGSIYIHIKGKTLPDNKSLLKYIVSLRNENHFHEEICEMTFKRLYDYFQPKILMVTCLYTRRGGVDICPARANAPEYLPIFLPQAELLTQRPLRN